MVRENLGEDAVIVATREENGGRAVRVTAAVEQEDAYASSASPLRGRERGTIPAFEDDFEDDFDGGGPHFEIETVATPASAREWLQYDSEDEENAVIEQLTDLMLRHGVADEITDQILSCATVIGMDRADMSLIAALEHLYSFRPLPQKTSGTAIMLVGPPGAGKTLIAAKLAARAVMNGQSAAVITTDTIRAGGVEQLSAFTNLLRTPLQKAASAKELRAAIENAHSADQIIIDTGGFNPFAPEEMRDLARLIAAGDIEPVLVLPAGIDADESGEIARIYAALGVRSLMPSRIDIARRLGGLLGAAHHGGLIFADAGNTPKVADGLIPLSPQRLARLLMPQTSARQQTSQTRHPTRNVKTG